MGAVTARQRESIPAGTGTTDLARETATTPWGVEKRERPRGSCREKQREGKEKRAVSREEQEVAAGLEAENDGRRGTSLAHRRTQGANGVEQSADTCLYLPWFLPWVRCRCFLLLQILRRKKIIKEIVHTCLYPCCPYIRRQVQFVPW